MSAPRSNIDQAQSLTRLQADWAALVDEQHLCAFSRDALARSRFVALAASGFSRLDHARVVVLRGSAITDLYSLCAQLEHGLGLERLRRAFTGRAGIIDSLRDRSVLIEPKPIRRRYVIWDDAHVLLRENPALFGRVADTLMGVSAEWEFSPGRSLLLQRVVFVGSSALEMYALDPRSQFSRWRARHGRQSYWATVSGQPRPAVGRYAIPEVPEAA